MGVGRRFHLAREVTERKFARSAAEANRVVWEELPVTICFVTEEEAARFPAAQEPARTGLLRLVEVADFDLVGLRSAGGRDGRMDCGRWMERFKGATRLSFVLYCALRSHGTLRDIVTAATRSVSSIQRNWPLDERRAEHGRTTKRLQAESADFQAQPFARRRQPWALSRGACTQAGADAVAQDAGPGHRQRTRNASSYWWETGRRRRLWWCDWRMWTWTRARG